jgi:hypothetical protein
MKRWDIRHIGKECLTEEMEVGALKIYNFYKEGLFCDFDVVGGNDEVFTKAHMLILASKSEAIETAMSNSFKPTNHVMLSEDKDVSLAVLEFIYTGCFSKESTKIIDGRVLWQALEVWGIHGGMRILMEMLTPQNFFAALECARFNKDDRHVSHTLPPTEKIHTNNKVLYSISTKHAVDMQGTPYPSSRRRTLHGMY